MPRALQLIHLSVTLANILHYGLGKQFVPDISTDPYLYEAESLPTVNDTSDVINHRLTPTIGNGHISTHVFGDTVYMNGFYNGHFGDSHRARLEAQHAIWLSVENEISRRHTLDTRRGIFQTKITTPNATVTYLTYAHQYFNRLLVTDITIARTGNNTSGDIRVNVERMIGESSNDVEVIQNLTYNNFQLVSIKTLIPEFNSSDVIPAFTAYTPLVDSTLTLKNGNTTYRNVLVFGADLFTDDSLKKDLDNVTDLLSESDGADELLKLHTDRWATIWIQGRIELEGNLEAQKAITSALYYMYSSLPAVDANQSPNMFWGISPGGLANGGPGKDYYGHVFWDMDTWMFPGILMFRPDLAKEMLRYRMYTMPPSFDRAKSGGYTGTRFPWESAYTGQEVCPNICVECRENQQHITGDIAFAAHQYLSATRDIDWLTEEQEFRSINVSGYTFLKQMAAFWESRPTKNARRGRWEINGVMPPDEYQKSVNNSVYTNAVAAYAVNYARYAACLAGKDEEKEIPTSWIDKMRKLAFPFDKKNRFHNEFDGYQDHRFPANGTKDSTKPNVKQADVILLGFPLLWTMPDDVRRNDLRHYEDVTDPFGPAMTWGMFCINWLELGDEAEAGRMFNRSYQMYIRQPFKLWTEVQNGLGAINFVTGMGGFLQTLVFGYGGMRLHSEELDFNPPTLPPGTTKMSLYGVQYLGATFDLVVDESGAKVIVRKIDRDMKLVIHSSGLPEKVLEEGKSYTPGTNIFRIFSTKNTNCEIPTNFIDVDYGEETNPSTTTTSIGRAPAASSNHMTLIILISALCASRALW